MDIVARRGETKKVMLVSIHECDGLFTILVYKPAGVMETNPDIAPKQNPTRDHLPSRRKSLEM